MTTRPTAIPGPPPLDADPGEAGSPIPRTSGEVAARYERVRRRSLWLTEVLETEDFGVQPMADASPARWHLAHTTWFFETFLLKPYARRHVPFHPSFEVLFNSYYNGVGAQFPRHLRGTLSRPTTAEVLDYRAAVDDAMATLIAERGEEPELRQRTILGTHHEEQHQELIVTDLKVAFGWNPLQPAWGRGRVPDAGAGTRCTFTEFAGGLVEIGAGAEGAGAPERFTFDNEHPRHRVWLEPFALADRCVTCGEWLAFMEDDGYRRPELWLSDGWSRLADAPAPDALHAPMYWSLHDGVWWEYTLGGARRVDPHAPVTHVSAYEADAYARWAGARLPTEAEWEHAAAASAPTTVDAPGFHPRADDGREPGPRALLGNQWEWTATAYGPYPGYEPLAGTLGEYNGKFMANQLVLRGGSCATPPGHGRIGYRNFFYPPDRWQFTGVRLARQP